jgi:hypothetical protein
MTSSISQQMLSKSNPCIINSPNLKRILLPLKTMRRVSVKYSKIKSIFKILPKILHKLTTLGCLTLMIFSSDKSLLTQSFRALELKRDSNWSTLIKVTRQVTAIGAMNRMSLIRCCLVAIQWDLLHQLLLIIKPLIRKIKHFRLNLNLCRCLVQLFQL